MVSDFNSTGMEELFLGSYEHTLDAKGRVIIPAELRKGLGEEFFVTSGYDGCIVAYPQKNMLQLAENMKQHSYNRSDVRLVIRGFFSNARKVTFDKLGRICIPQKLRDMAGINGKLVIVGAIDKVEIWSEENWSLYLQNSEGYEKAAEKLDIG
jgi:MraZ protein